MGARIGQVGEIHPLTARAYDLDGRVAAGELDLAPMLAPVEDWQLDEPSVYPPVQFDLAFEVEESLPADEPVAGHRSGPPGRIRIGPGLR